MALKNILKTTYLISAIVLVVAEYECYYKDGRVLSCNSCCEYDCCAGIETNISAVIGGSVGGSLLFVALIIICCARVRRSRIASRGQILAHPSSNVLVVSSTTYVEPDDTPRDSRATGVTERPVYNPNVPQTGPYTYEQPIAFANFPSGLMSRADTIPAEAPPPYSPDK